MHLVPLFLVIVSAKILLDKHQVKVYTRCADLDSVHDRRLGHRNGPAL